jgi:hypothetical protein
MSKIVLVLIAAFSVSASLVASSANAGQHPCEVVESTCAGAGFIKGQAKAGNGLWEDCINPIMQGQTIPNAVKPIPSVDPGVVAACHAKRPKFGEGKIGSK